MALHISLFNIFFSLVILINNWRINKNSVFLSLLIFLISTFSVAHHLVLNGNSAFWLGIFYNNPSPLWYLIGPSLYFYVRGVLKDRIAFTYLDLLHTIPFWLNLIGILPYLATSFEYKLSVANTITNNLGAMKNIRVNWIVPVWVNLFLRPVLQIIYAIISILIIIQFSNKNQKTKTIPKRQLSFLIRWLITLGSIVLLIGIYYLWVSIIYFSNPVIGREIVKEYQLLYLLGSVLIFMPFMLIVFPEILYGIPKYQLNQLKTIATINHLNSDSPLTEVLTIRSEDKKEMHPHTDEHDVDMPDETKISKEQDPFNELADKIFDVLKEKQPYLNYDFSLDDLAGLLNVPKHHLYYCFRNIIQNKFTSLRTEYRINHAKKLLREIDLRKTTLDAVGRSSGFQSRSGFYNTFKAEVGCSPGEYQIQYGINQSLPE